MFCVTALWVTYDKALYKYFFLLLLLRIQINLYLCWIICLHLRLHIRIMARSLNLKNQTSIFAFVHKFAIDYQYPEKFLRGFFEEIWSSTISRKSWEIIRYYMHSDVWNWLKLSTSLYCVTHHEIIDFCKEFFIFQHFWRH